MPRKSGKRGRKSQEPKNSRVKHTQNALNAFDIAEDEVDDAPFGKIDISEGEDEDGSKRDYLSGEVRPEDDEEIDSDEAFGSDEDELDFMASHDRKNRKNKRSNEQDDDEEYDSIDESELLPLSEIWDRDDQDNASSSDGDSGESDNEDNESELSFSDEDDDVADEEQLNKLRAKINAMDQSLSSKKQRLQINNAQESEFALPTGGQKLSLADLTSSVSDPMIDTNTGKSLSIPLPKRIQQRHDRSAAFGLAKDELDKWNDTVKANREAEHLQFPMNAPPQVQKPTPHSEVKPSTELESKVQNLLEQSALADEKSLSTFEELAPSKLSMEEVKKRRNELRLMRELLFREEQKAKRIKKIKSKQYRKIHKRERERLQALNESEDEDSEDHDRRRAQERMSLKHKNTGKWARRMVSQGFTKDQETRAEMEEMLRRGEDLRKKIHGSDSESEDDTTFLNREDDSDNDGSDNENKKGILGMKFMRDAEAAKKRQNQEDIEALRNGDFTGFEDLEESNGATNTVINAGRRTFKPGTADVQEEVIEALQQAREDQLEDEEDSVKSRLSKAHAKSTRVAPSESVPQSKSKASSKDKDDEEEEENPWAQLDDNAPVQKKSKTSVVDGQSSKTEKNQLKVKKQRGKSSATVNSDNVMLDMNETLQMVDALGSDGEQEQTTSDASMVRAKKLMSFEQKDLVKRAFAGDDVVDEFQEEKRRRVADEGDKEVDVTIPGWGSWGGTGTKQRKKFTKKVDGIKADKRKDAKLQNVIINEKVNKKLSKYTSSAVPFPYENREQYELSLRMPMGQEWASKATHQKLTKPRVIVKQGTVIDPIKAPFK
uniref:ARAD1A04532p n=1 Tax=Blastobotrys adeninivorans TaxID=409370 RepID=A0A060SXK3_BLAAD